tara:strand:- start:1097 stop:1333 length:237 start_codon:yes stop_codon:yes gene_type:complete
MNSIENKLKKVFSTTFRIDEKYIKSSSNFKNIKKWDSLNHVKLILAIESKFKISIKPDDSVELLSFKEICNYLQKNLK